MITHIDEEMIIEIEQLIQPTIGNNHLSTLKTIFSINLVTLALFLIFLVMFKFSLPGFSPLISITNGTDLHILSMTLIGVVLIIDVNDVRQKINIFSSKIIRKSYFSIILIFVFIFFFIVQEIFFIIWFCIYYLISSLNFLQFVSKLQYVDLFIFLTGFHLLIYVIFVIITVIDIILKNLINFLFNSDDQELFIFYWIFFSRKIRYSSILTLQIHYSEYDSNFFKHQSILLKNGKMIRLFTDDQLKMVSENLKLKITYKIDKNVLRFIENRKA
jgi:hypothetical protein